MVTSGIGADCTLAAVAVSTISRRPLAVLLTLSGLLVVGAGALAVVAVVTHDGGTGPVLVRVDDRHGLHLGDIPVLVMPLLGLVLLGIGHRLGRRER